MKYFALLLALALCACSTTPQPPVVPDVPVVQQKTTVNIEPGLIAPCAPLQPLTAQEYSQGDSTTMISIWASQYDACAKRFTKFVNLVGPVLNINEAPSSPVPASATTITQ
jgi:hypothetical protein